MLRPEIMMGRVILFRHDPADNLVKLGSGDHCVENYVANLEIFEITPDDNKITAILKGFWRIECCFQSVPIYWSISNAKKLHPEMNIGNPMQQLCAFLLLTKNDISRYWMAPRIPFHSTLSVCPILYQVRVKRLD